MGPSGFTHFQWTLARPFLFSCRESRPSSIPSSEFPSQEGIIMRNTPQPWQRPRSSVLGVLISLACAALLLIAGCGSGSGGSTPSNSSPTAGSTAAAASPNTITIKNFAFDPMTLTVAPGATVTVKNEDTATHTVTATDKSFNSGDVAPGATKTFTAPKKAGSYSYICSIHNYMQGTLTVK
jgi:plastocyanin